jgi:hypothetical protein
MMAAKAPAKPAAWVARGMALLKTLGPYAALELLLPGGSLIALLLWLYQRRHSDGATGGVMRRARWPLERGGQCGKLPERRAVG